METYKSSNLGNLVRSLVEGFITYTIICSSPYNQDLLFGYSERASNTPVTPIYLSEVLLLELHTYKSGNVGRSIVVMLVLQDGSVELQDRGTRVVGALESLHSNQTKVISSYLV